jgi:phosphoserine/homoserine phosphotransferase
MADMYVICSDLEGVFVPEVWVNVAKKTGIDKLKLTTREIQDYDKLMKYRIEILDQENLSLNDIQNVIAQIKPLDGAFEFLEWCKQIARIVIVSDTFVEFADPLMAQLGRPMLLCHSLLTDDKNMIRDYKLRQPDPKRKTVQAFQDLQYKVLAFGDSYNDISMLQQADVGILYCPPDNVVKDYPDFPVARNYSELQALISKYIPN